MEGVTFLVADNLMQIISQFVLGCNQYVGHHSSLETQTILVGRPINLVTLIHIFIRRPFFTSHWCDSSAHGTSPIYFFFIYPGLFSLYLLVFHSGPGWIITAPSVQGAIPMSNFRCSACQDTNYSINPGCSLML